MEALTFLDVTRLMALSQSLFFSLYAGLYLSKKPAGLAFFIVGLCGCGEILRRLYCTNCKLLELSAFLSALDLLTACLPMALWVAMQYLLKENYKKNLRLITLSIPVIGLYYVGLTNLRNFGELSTLEYYVYTLPWEILFFAVAVHILCISLMDASNDLVESRRKLRLPLVITVASLIIVAVVLRLSDNTTALDLVEIPANLFIYFGMNLVLFRFDASLSESTKARVGRPKMEMSTLAHGSIEEGLHKLMVEKKCYRKAGLTINELALQLEVPEYKLRRVINQTLGYRNFNQYLNSFRIEEAGQRLENEDVPVLTLSLDLGYKSLASFNKIFKEIHHLTPTEYRRISRQAVSTRDATDQGTSGQEAP